MKKFLALLLALLMCVGVLAACAKKDEGTGGGNEAENGGEKVEDTDEAATLDDAKELLNSMMKSKNGKATPNDYDVVAAVKVGTTKFEVTWKTNNENIKVKESSEEGFWTIDVPDVNTEEVEYELTATIKDANGDTVELTFTPKLPVIDNAGVATEFEAGVPYKIFMKQMNVGVTVYALNTTQKGENKFIETTLDPKAAATYYVEVVEGGYKIYTEIDGVKNYLHATATPKETGTGFTKAIGFAKETDCVFTYDKELALFKVKLSGEEFGVGSYNAYETLSISEVKYFTADKINVEGGQFPIGFMTKEHADTLTPSERPISNDPAADSTLTIAQANELGKSKVSGLYTDAKYYVTGEITKIESADNYGNITIKDPASGETFYIYGTYDSTGNTKFGKLETKPAVGDTITVYGIIGNYNDSAQMKNGFIQDTTGEGGNEGGSTTTPTVNTQVVEAPVVGTAYKFGMVQTKAGKTVYITGEMSGYYMATVENAANAADVYLEETTGGYYLYVKNGENKSYINLIITVDSKDAAKRHVNAAFEATASTVYTMHETLKTLVTHVEVTEYTSKTGDYVFGTRNDKDYTTVGAVFADASASFICQFYTVVEGGEEGGTTPTPPACENHIDSNNDFVCDTEGCDVVVEPEANSILTFEQANALGVALKGKQSASKYYVVGTIKQVYNTNYGNMYINDDNGVQFTLFGTFNNDGTQEYKDMTDKPVAGDTIKAYGVIGSYQGKAQMIDAWIVEHTAHVCDYDDATCTAPKTCKICGATDGAANGHGEANAEGKCPICGINLNAPVETFNILSKNGTLVEKTITWESDNFTFVGKQAGSSTAIRVNESDDHYRIYQNSTFAINAKNDKKITKIVVTVTESKYATPLVNSVTAEGVTATADGTTVTIEFAEAVESFEFTAGAQTRVKAFAISYTD